MPVYKDESRNTWYSRVMYHDWTGKYRERKKRGFETKREAVAWERSFLEKNAGEVDMSLGSLVDLYYNDMDSRLKDSTMDTKKNIIENHILFYFKNRKVNEITPPDVRAWQNEISKKGFSQTYLKTINNQFSALMNYACRYYGLQSNPVRVAGSMGRAHTEEEMKVWTKEQFEAFISTVREPSYKLLYSILFWSGIRVGEAMVLLPTDLVEKEVAGKTKRFISVTKTYYRKGGVTYYNTPKTNCSRRDVTIPDFLWDMAQDYLSNLFDWDPEDPIFWFTKSAVNKHMARHCAAAGVDPIRVHDLRHSHASMLINMGKPILEISKRLGHKTVATTWDTYAHLYPDKDIGLAEALQAYSEQSSQNHQQTQEEKVEDLKRLLGDLPKDQIAKILTDLLTGNL